MNAKVSIIMGSTSVYFIGIIYFGKSALNSLKIGVPNMDVLIFIGSSAQLLMD